MGDSETTPGDDQRARIEADFLERLQEEMRQMTVEDHLLHLVRSLPSMAFQYMGIYQAEGVRDLTQARLAIDAFRVLLDVLAPVRTPEEMAMYRSTLAQMQMTYVTAAEQAAGAAGQHSHAAQPAAEEPGDSEVAEALYDDEGPAVADEPPAVTDDARRSATDDAPPVGDEAPAVTEEAPASNDPAQEEE